MVICVTKKFAVTSREIGKDIVRTAGQADRLTKKSYESWRMPAIIIALVSLVVTYIYPLAFIYAVLAVAVITVIAVLGKYLRLRRFAVKFSIDDYEIKTDTLSHVDLESFEVRRGKWRRDRVENYMLCFEELGTYYIPEDNYLWNVDARMSDRAVFEKAHRGDKFIVAVHRKSGKLSAVYHADYFEYKADR